MLSKGEAKLLELIHGGILAVRDDGSVWCSARQTRTGRWIPSEPRRIDKAASKGYRRVTITINKVEYGAQAHRLAWIVRHGPIPPKIEVNHEDGVRDSNGLANLNLMTHGQNQAHSYAKLGRPRPVGERNGSARLTPAKVAEIRAARGQRSSRELGREHGISHRSVLNIWSGHTWGSV